MPAEAVIRRDYTFNDTSFDFAAWKESSEVFQCPNTHHYTLLCKYRWDTIKEELEELRNIEGAGGLSMMFICIIAFEAIAIVVLIFYAYILRKKANNSEQECKIDESDASKN